jgi:nicotinate-nucleotide--dimethylbenzimidazole phosphoribosyltransferase
MDAVPTLTEAEIRAQLDRLTKPPGSLGRFEDLAARLCAIQQTLRPATRPRLLALFAGDHGVVDEGVTAWPRTVTAAMVENILAGGAASSVLARSTGTILRLIDVGTQAPAQPESDGYRCARIAAGTANLAHQPAMDPDQLEAALAIGAGEAARACEHGVRVVAAGEMGIGNSTPAACLAALLGGFSTAAVTGRGAGADDATLARKRAVVAHAVERVRPRLASQPRHAMAAVAGFEIAAIAGFYIHAARSGLTIVLDGFIATAAAMMAEHLAPGTAAAMIAAHHSAEPGHPLMLAHLGLTPFLDWRMRLGEGSGALLLMPLLDAATAMIRDMASFDSAGIARA